MPRRKSASPAYQFHVSGQARVSIDGRDYYLGKHGTPESYARYHAMLAAYNANGMKMPEAVPTHQESTEILVRHVTADFRTRVLPNYESNNGQHNRYSNLCDLLDKRHGDEPVADFGPRKLEAMRDGFVADGNCRKYANTKCGLIVRIIEHGVSRELVQPDRIVALRSLPPLKRGQAREAVSKSGASVADIEKAMSEMSETVQDMLRMQLATAMRPSEIFAMTMAEIDRDHEVWFYRPAGHKTEHHGKRKAVPLIGVARQIVEYRSSTPPNEPLFVNELGTPWNKDTYRRHVTRASERAGAYFTPYQLRHTAAQIARDEAGPEAAQALLGHSRLSTTEIYAKASEAKAIEAAVSLTRVNGSRLQ